MIFKTKPKAQKQNIVIQELENETLIYDLNINKAFCLNSTSAMIWQLCNGEKTVAEIADLMSKDLKMSVSEDFVWLAINDLQKENLVEFGNNKPFLKGKSRRELIRKIGFASMVALPIVSSLVAPNAVEAQSGGLALLATCTGPQCASGLTCRATTQNGGTGFVPTGFSQCCAGSGADTSDRRHCAAPGDTSCAPSSFLCCSNSANIAATPLATCGARLTCSCV